MSVLRSELAAEAWRQRYVEGRCELEEMEAGVARALAGETSDREWVELAQDRGTGSMDEFLRSLYWGPISM